MSGAEDLLRPCLSLCLVASFQLPPTPFKKHFFLLLVVFHVSLCLPHSLFAFCAFLSSFVCLSFGGALKYSACSSHVLSEQLCLLLYLLPPFFSPFLCRSACLAHVLPRARFVFGFFVLFFRFLIVL